MADADERSTAEGEPIRVRAREGEEVEWSRKAAQRAGTLRDMMDDAETDQGVYPAPVVAAADLEILGALCEADPSAGEAEPASAMLQRSVPELFGLVQGAIFLDASVALEQVQKALRSRLAGKRSEELRALLGASDDLEERAAALAEPAFTPEGGGDEPALQQQPSLLMVTDDTKLVAVGRLEVGTLIELKGVSRAWRAIARRVLCSRVCGREGPTELGDITDVNVKVLVEVGRPWEAAAAGRQLAGLARLHWQGLEVDVAAVRGVDLDEDDEEEDEEDNEEGFLSGAAKAALLSCITGEGERPLELLLAAVACAGSDEARRIPVEAMRNDAIAELDLRGLSVGVEGYMLIAYLLPVMASLTSLSLASNNLTNYGTEMSGIKAIADALSINASLTVLDLSRNGLGSKGGKALAPAIAASASLTELTIYGNSIGNDGAQAIADALKMNNSCALKTLWIDNSLMNHAGLKAACQFRQVQLK